MAEHSALKVIDLEAYRKRISCVHCGRRVMREGELSGRPFYVHIDGYVTCDPDAEDSTFATPSPVWQ